MVNEVVLADLQINLNNRPLDTIKVLKYARDFAVEKKVTRVAVCGDIYEYRNPKPEEQKIFQQWVKSVVDEGIEVLLVVGNHDTVTAKLKKGTYYTFGEFKNLDFKGVKVVDSGYKENGIYYGHFLLKGAKMGPIDYVYDLGMTAEELALANPDCTLFLLGDVHKHQLVSDGVVYVGSPERENFGERNEEKGFLWVYSDSEDGRFINWEFIPTPARTMLQVELDFTKGNPYQTLPDVEGAIVKVVVTVNREGLKEIRQEDIEKMFGKAYELSAIEYCVVEAEKKRNHNINESKTPLDCLEEYSRQEGLEKEVFDEGVKILREVA
jgi:DNA repair exonuclease SbcCD nuclease subunit